MVDKCRDRGTANARHEQGRHVDRIDARAVLARQREDHALAEHLIDLRCAVQRQREQHEQQERMRDPAQRIARRSDVDVYTFSLPRRLQCRKKPCSR